MGRAYKIFVERESIFPKRLPTGRGKDRSRKGLVRIISDPMIIIIFFFFISNKIISPVATRSSLVRFDRAARIKKKKREVFERGAITFRKNRRFSVISCSIKFRTSIYGYGPTTRTNEMRVKKMSGRIIHIV